VTRPCAHCGRNRSERFFVSAAGRVCSDCQKRTRRTSQRAGHVARTYSLTPDQHAALLAHQSGVCAICGQERRYALNVDHDHATGKVRGLLCRRCNKLLAAARDDVELLMDAVNYLRWPPTESIREVPA
jgi:ribosomal protein L28